MQEKTQMISKSNIGDNSNYNNIYQNSKIFNPLLVTNTDLIGMLSQCGHHEVIQDYFHSIMSSIRISHKLFPDFGVKHHLGLNRLISNPETEDAFDKYPKIIKSTFQVDYKQYPHMNKSESLLEYAYRTQQVIKLKTIAYKEYLGDVEDPYPLAVYEDGMMTTITPPDFPPAQEAIISSKESSMPVLIRRKPSMDYGRMIIGTLAEECGFSFDITIDSDSVKNNITLNRLYDVDLNKQLQREKLFNSIYKNKQLKIAVGDAILINAEIGADIEKSKLFADTPYIINYIESLLIIEKHTGCKFSTNLEYISNEDYRLARIFSDSLEGRWHTFRSSFDNKMKVGADSIDSILDASSNQIPEFYIESQVLGINLQGQSFSAEKYTSAYKNAMINNAKSLAKKRHGRRRDIMITIKPIEGNEYFIKSCRFEGVKFINGGE